MRASNTAGYGITSQETESYTLTAPPGSLAASLVENTGVDLSWMDASTKETGYLVEMGTSADDLQKLASLPAGTATYKVRGLAPDTTYFFQVSSINTPGARSSATTTATTTSASNWSITGDASLEGTSITQGQTLTLADEEEVAYGDHQDSGLHGGSIKLGSQDRYHFYFEVDYSTWDSYSPIVPWAGHEPATEGGYWDLFSISMTDQSYANTSRTDGNPNAFPMNAPYTRYDTTYRDSVTASNWDEDLVMSFTGSQTASKYLNVMLDTETDPQAGHLHPSYGTVVVKQIPELTIQAIHDQVAEGGETPGKVRITRKTTALTDPLDVSFTRLNADGTTTSHTATIAAGEDSVDVYVAAPAPHVNNPIDVTFTLTPQIDKYVLGAASAPTNAKVTILKQKAILVTFMGLGDGSSLDGGQGDGFGAGLLRETTVSQTTGALGKLDDKFLPANLFVKVYGEREGDLVRREIAEKVNRNIDKFISKAETEAVILNLAGYSYGAVQAANVAFTLGQSQKQFMGYELEVDVPVKNMVMIDAETDWFKVLLGTDYANVEGYKAFYQRKGQMVRVYRRYFDENGAEGPEQLAAAGSWIDQSWMIKGNPMDGLGHVNANKSAINVTDDAAWKNQRRGETFSDRIEYVDGARAQHQSIVYFLKNKNLANPSGQTLVDWLVEDMVP